MMLRFARTETARNSFNRAEIIYPPGYFQSLSHLAAAPIGTGTDQPSFRNGKWGYTYMRYQRAYTRRQRAVTFAGATRTVTIPLEIPDFERLERLATEYNVGNATLCRQIIRQYLKRKAEKGLTLEPTP